MSKLIVPMSNRTNYSKIRPVLLELKKYDQVSIHIVLSSGILLNQYGNAIDDVSFDGFCISHKIDCLLSNDSLESMSKTIGLSMIEHSTMYSLYSPDAVLVTGDRFDILSAVLSSRIMNIPVLHIQGGEISGSIDNKVRDIITICSDRHYVATESALERVSSLVGRKNVFNFGCPAVEMITEMVADMNVIGNIWNDLDIQNEKYFLVALHPNTTDENDIDMDVVLDSVLSFGVRCIIFCPNPDAFNSSIVNSIHKKDHLIKLIRHIPIELFAMVMFNAICMIGNSSAGIREAASFGTPVVNIGSRQQQRERNNNTIDVSCDRDQICNAIKTSMIVGKYAIQNVYYQTGSAKKIAKNISEFLIECV